MIDSYDFLVIGGGSAGYAGALTAAQLGLKSAVVEGAEEIGGLCILRGCMPSKALLESAHRAEVVRHAGAFGIHAEYRGASAAEIRTRKRRLIGEFATYRRTQLERAGFDFIRGRARFADTHHVEIALLGGGTRVVEAKTALIATGSVVKIPPIPGLAEAGYWTSDDVLDADQLPKSVCILGGGAIALEAGSFYQGLAVPTTVIQRSAQVLREMDTDIAEELVQALRRRGMIVHVDTKLHHVSKGEDQKLVHFTDGDGQTRIVEAEAIVCALGREPFTRDLGLSSAGVALDGSRIIVEQTQQTSIPHLFAAGDVCGPHEVVHLAIQQAEVAARNSARLLGRHDGPPEHIDYMLKLFAVFTQPQAAAVGLTESEARAQGFDFLTAKYPFSDHGKSIIRDEIDGFVKLIADRSSGRIIGGACLGPEASELIHEIVVAMRFGATAAQLASTPHYHPTLSEIWTYPAEELAKIA
jgi:pyruvate/2-oxoglutarate dehydrogenase complex dihydrolipoamide dehydrogenase (E3) component